MAHVFVLGDSMGVSLETAKEALVAGHRVCAFARSAFGIDLSDDELERLKGDALDAGDVVVQALGVPVRYLLGPMRLFSDATNLLVTAMERAGVNRLIAVTGFGAGDSRDGIGLLQRLPFRLMLGRAYDDKDAQEMRILRSGLAWTLVRPGILTSGAPTGRFQALTEPSTWRNGRIARVDVAEYIVGQIAEPSHAGRTVVHVR